MSWGVQRKRRDFLFYDSSFEKHKGPILFQSTKPTEEQLLSHMKGRGELLRTTSSCSLLFCSRMPSILLVILTERIRKSVHGARKHVNGHPNAETISEVTERQLPLKYLFLWMAMFVIQGIPVIPVTSFNPADLLILGHERVNQNHSPPSFSALPFASSSFAPCWHAWNYLNGGWH